MTEDRNRSQGGFSRRNFLGRLAGGSTVAVVGLSEIRAAFARTLQSVSSFWMDTLDDSTYWERIRSHFILDDGFAYLNTGTLGPTPRPVVRAMNEYWRLMAVNPNENSAVFQNHVEQIRVKLAAFFGARPDEIAITRNTTEGNTILCQGLDLEPGDEILITAYEHASNRETQKRQAKRRGLVVKEVQFPMPPASPQVIIDAFAAAIAPKTRVMHFGNPLGGYGCIMPVKELASLARSKRILCFVDGAHATGMFQFNLKEWGVDGFACNSHKWLCGAAGAGVLFVRREVQDRVAPVVAIWRDEPTGARKYDQLSRRPWPTVMAFEDIIDFHTAIGGARIEARARSLGTYLRTGLVAIPKVKVYTPMDPAMSCATTTAGIEGVPAVRIREYLRQRYDAYVPGGSDRIRVSTHYFNTQEHVDRVLSAYRELASGVA